MILSNNTPNPYVPNIFTVKLVVAARPSSVTEKFEGYQHIWDTKVYKYICI